MKKSKIIIFTAALLILLFLNLKVTFNSSDNNKFTLQFNTTDVNASAQIKFAEGVCATCFDDPSFWRDDSWNLICDPFAGCTYFRGHDFGCWVYCTQGGIN